MFEQKKASTVRPLLYGIKFALTVLSF